MRYNRTAFNYDSTRARELMMKTEALLYDKTLVLHDVYNGNLLDPNKDLWHVEHIFPLKSAWDAGFRDLYARDRHLALEMMQTFANDTSNMVVTNSSSNMSRGNKTLWNWVPLNLHFIPYRNQIIREMADKYGLTLTKTQFWAMAWADKKITKKHRHGIRMGAVRSWLFRNGFHRIAVPF